jgi:hypothetical protein
MYSFGFIVGGLLSLTVFDQSNNKSFPEGGAYEA